MVFQYGKCGSSAVQKYLGLKTFGQFHVPAKALKFLDSRPSEETIWIVTMVRNRFLRDISSAFENRLIFKINPKDNMEKLATSFKIAYNGGKLNTHHWFKEVFEDVTGVDLLGHAQVVISTTYHPV